MQKPILTIAILSHNHERFIEKAIKGVLSQKCSYSYELLLFDDASTDTTPSIINTYASKYPEIIRTFCFTEISGPVARAKQIFENSIGKYITWIDGDDYWTYHSKLQIQIDFLEANKDYAGCFHDALIKSESVTLHSKDSQIARQSLHKYRYYSQFNHYEPDFYPFHLINRNIIPTASLIFRKADFSHFFSTYKLPPYSFSWAFQLEVIRNSKLKFFNRCWSVYVDHNNGLSKKISAKEFTLNNINILKFFKSLNGYSNHKYILYKSIAKEYSCINRHPESNKIIFKYILLSSWYSFWALFLESYYYKVEYFKSLFKTNNF